jgi:hypothetical protein
MGQSRDGVVAIASLMHPCCILPALLVRRCCISGASWCIAGALDPPFPALKHTLAALFRPWTPPFRP